MVTTAGERGLDLMCRLVSISNGRYVADIKLTHIQNIIKQADLCKNINRVMLFGSSLEERCTEKSDVDIAVFGKKSESRYLDSKEFRQFQDRIFKFDIKQDYDILYFCESKKYNDLIMKDIENGAEIFRREPA